MRNSKYDALIFTKALIQNVDALIKKEPYEPKVPKDGLHFTEDVAQSSILDYLLLQMVLGKLFVQRVNNTPIYDQTRGTYRAMAKGTHKGFPDIYVLKNGRSIFFEVKSSTGSQSKDQVKMQALLEAQGAEYYIVRSVEYVQRVVGA